jgi:basic membrane protein A
MHTIAKLAGALSLVALLAGAAQAQTPLKLCQITDTGGIDDRSFNETAWKGFLQAQTDLGAEVKYLESTSEADYEPHLASFLAEGCDLIMTVGFLLGDATKAAAEANPDTKYSIVDFAYDPAVPNIVGQVFNTDEAAFLAGYLSAGVSKTGKVGTFGGLPIPTVTIFMDGFARGVAHYNAVKGTAVEVLGYNVDTGEGLFTNNFDSLEDGRSFAQSLYDEGADIVMPVAGPVGLGSAALAGELGADKLMVIGVDADSYLTNPERGGVYLTSVLKNMNVTAFNVAKSVMDGTYEGGVVVGTLENGGVGLAPFHDLDAAVPDALKAEIAELTAAVLAGTVSVKG